MKKLVVREQPRFPSLSITWAKLGTAIKFVIIFLLLSAITSINPPKASAQFSVSFQVFYDNLSPYGDWVHHSNYGDVWVPRHIRNFTPYGSNGHWVYTRHGWTWVSNYRWGWAPFHYGRWFHDRYYGWVWVPDTQWGPGWVTWRRSQGYYGWAPIGPGISIDFGYSNNYNLPYDDWRFVREQDFGRADITNYYISTNNYTTIINNSTVIVNIQSDPVQNVRYNAGPDRVEAEQRSGRRFEPVAIKESNKPEENLSGNELRIYKPQVQKEVGGRKPAPTRVTEWKGDQQPVVQPKKEPVVEPRKEPVVQPKREPPVVQPKKEPVVEPRKEPVVQPKREPPVVEPRKEPVVQPRKEPVVEPRKEPVVQPRKEPVVEPRKEPVVQPKREPPVQTKKEPVVEPKKEPVVQPKKEPPVQQKKDPPVPPKKDDPPVKKK